MQPTFKIEVVGQGDITALIAERLIQLDITDRAGVKSDTLSLELDDQDQRFTFPKTGAKLQVWLGYVGSELVDRGTYAVDEVSVSGPLRTLTIHANAADMNGGIKSPKERSFHNIKFGDLVKKIAKEHDLKPSISAKLAARDLGHIDQTESDMQLLSRICTEQGATMKCASGRLIIADHGSGKSNSGKDLPKITINAGDCAGWSANISKRNSYKSVKAFYQDIGKSKRTGVTAGSGSPVLTLKNSYRNAEEAKQAANSKLNGLGRGASTLQISGFIGDPKLAAECKAEIIGFRDGIDGSGWVVNQVTHSMSASGYINTLELEAS